VYFSYIISLYNKAVRSVICEPMQYLTVVCRSILHCSHSTVRIHISWYVI